MNCSQCGAPLTPGKAFCNQCGAPTGQAAPQQAPQPIPQQPQAQYPPYAGGNAWQGQPAQAYPQGYYQPPPMPAKKKGGKKLVIILVSLLLVAAIVTSLFVFVIDLRSPEQRVRDAMQNTQDTIQAERVATDEALGISRIMAQVHDGQALIDFSTSVQIPESEAMAGASMTNPQTGEALALEAVSITGAMRTDLAQGCVDLDLGLGIDGTPLVNMQIGARDELIAISSPELFSGSLGFNQNSFGADYANSIFAQATEGGATAIDPEMSFDLVGTLSALTETAPAGEPRFYSTDTQGALDALEETLWAAATVEKGDATEVSVNGVTQACEVYNAVYERPAFIDYLYAYVDTILADEELDLGMLGGLSSMSGTESLTGEDLEASVYEALATIEQAISENVEVCFYVQDDRLLRMEALFFGGADSFGEMELVLEYGDGEALSNALTLTLSADGSEALRYETSGSQVIKDGIYSNTLSLTSMNGGAFAMDLWYDTAADFDNFTFVLSQNGAAAVEAEGSLQVNTTANTLDSDFTRLMVSGANGPAEIPLKFAIQPGEGLSFEDPAPTMLFEMSQSDMEALMQEIMVNAQNSEALAGMAGGI